VQACNDVQYLCSPLGSYRTTERVQRRSIWHCAMENIDRG